MSSATPTKTTAVLKGIGKSLASALLAERDGPASATSVNAGAPAAGVPPACYSGAANSGAAQSLTACQRTPSGSLRRGVLPDQDDYWAKRERRTPKMQTLSASRSQSLSEDEDEYGSDNENILANAITGRELYNFDRPKKRSKIDVLKYAIVDRHSEGSITATRMDAAMPVSSNKAADVVESVYAVANDHKPTEVSHNVETAVDLDQCTVQEARKPGIEDDINSGDEIPASNELQKHAAVALADGTPSSVRTRRAAMRHRLTVRVNRTVDTGTESEDDDEADESGVIVDGSTAGSRCKEVRAEEHLRVDMPDDEAETFVYEQYFNSVAAFGNSGGKKTPRGIAGATSNNTLANLPSLDRKEYLNVLTDVRRKQEGGIKSLRRLHMGQFYQWFLELSCGFNLCFYGFGSKRELLNCFAMTMCNDAPILVFNAYVPTLTIKDLLSHVSAYVNKDGARKVPATFADQLAFIEAYFNQAIRPIPKLYLVIHNIDGVGLRNERAQGLLSKLAAIPFIIMIASIDHINAGLLWDNSKDSRFNFIWHDATTFESYHVETSYENSAMVRSDELDAQGVKFILLSLPENSRKIFRIMADYQLHEWEDSETADEDVVANRDSLGGTTSATVAVDGEDQDYESSAAPSRGKNNLKYPGLSFGNLFQKCREKFVARSDIQLRQLLGEFRDHKVIHSWKDNSGEDILFIPLSKKALEGLLKGL